MLAARPCVVSALGVVASAVLALPAGCQRINPDFDSASELTGGGSGAGTVSDDGLGDSDGGHDGATDDGATGSAAGVDCTQTHVLTVLVSEAEIVPPMQRGQSELGEGEFAFSEVEGDGLIRFDVDVPCNDTFWIWGRVLDQQDGTTLENDPDSFYVSIDGGPAVTWFYGCQTSDTSGVWSWALADDNEFQRDCDLAEPMAPWLDAGPHTVELRNREPINGNGQHAGVARILVTNGPDHVPNADD